MAKPNYQFEKRQRELAKQKKKQEKAQRKAAGPAGEHEDGSPSEDAPADAGEAPAADEPRQPATEAGLG
ncbi:UNVERIFIED_ORG: hypothetical protein LHJ69_01930 [Shinella sp. XGS7]|nr:hypothetical protein [Shinella sp. XGS7]